MQERRKGPLPVIPFLIIALGTTVLLASLVVQPEAMLRFEPYVTLALAVIGILSFIIGQVDRLSLVAAPFFLLLCLLSMVGRIYYQFGIFEGPVLIIAIGVLLAHGADIQESRASPTFSPLAERLHRAGRGIAIAGVILCDIGAVTFFVNAMKFEGGDEFAQRVSVLGMVGGAALATAGFSVAVYKSSSVAGKWAIKNDVGGEASEPADKIMNIATDTDGTGVLSYHIISLAAPLVGVLASHLFADIFGHRYRWWVNWQDTTAVGILAASCLFGLITAIIVLARSNRLWGLSVLALILNAPLPLWFLWQGLLKDPW